MKEERHNVIGLMLYRDQDWSRRLIPGITRYARAYTDWELRLLRVDPDAEGIKSCQGLIGPVFHDEQNSTWREIRDGGIPAVNISEARPPEGIPLVTHDNLLVGKMAAEHLLSLGLKRFACIPLEKLTVSRKRVQGFQERLREAGFTDPESLIMVNGDLDTAKIDALPVPIGIFAINDLRARQLETLVRRHPHLEIPRDIALLGCDNDMMECELCTIPISSIDLDLDAVGFEAARQLHKLFKGEEADPCTLISPLGVVHRRSSDYLIHDDSMVRRVLERLRGDYAAKLNMTEIAREQGLTPRHVQRRFKAATGMTLQQMLLEIRLEKAKELLRDTPLNISEIALETGFTDVNRFPGYFRKRFGCTPRAYRGQLPNFR